MQCGADLKSNRDVASPTAQTWYRLPFRQLCEFCLAMPLIGLLICFVIACLFQFGDIQETACKV